MTVVGSTWKNYSKIKHDLEQELTGLQDSHTKELSSLQARLSQSGISTGEDQYKLRVDKLITDQSEAKRLVTDAQKDLETGAMRNILEDQTFADSYGGYVRNLGMKAARADSDAARLAEYGPGNELGMITPYNLNRLKAGGHNVQNFDDYFEEKFGAYERPEEEIRAEKSAASIAQARGVAGGQRAKAMTKRKSNAPVSMVGSNPFLSGGAGFGGGEWWK